VAQLTATTGDGDGPPGVAAPGHGHHSGGDFVSGEHRPQHRRQHQQWQYERAPSTTTAAAAFRSKRTPASSFGPADSAAASAPAGPAERLAVSGSQALSGSRGGRVVGNRGGGDQGPFGSERVARPKGLHAAASAADDRAGGWRKEPPDGIDSDGENGDAGVDFRLGGSLGGGGGLFTHDSAPEAGAAGEGSPRRRQERLGKQRGRSGGLSSTGEQRQQRMTEGQRAAAMRLRAWQERRKLEEEGGGPVPGAGAGEEVGRRRREQREQRPLTQPQPRSVRNYNVRED